MVVIRQKWLFSARTGCILAKVVVFWQGDCIWAKKCCNWEKLLYSGKVVKFEARVVVFGQSGCIRQKWLYSSKVVVSAKVVVFGQGGCIWAKWLLSGKSGCFRAQLVVFRTK